MFTLSLLTDRGYPTSVTVDRSALHYLTTFLVCEVGYIILAMRPA